MSEAKNYELRGSPVNQSRVLSAKAGAAAHTRGPGGSGSVAVDSVDTIRPLPVLRPLDAAAPHLVFLCALTSSYQESKTASLHF